MADLGEGKLASLPSDGDFQAEGSEEPAGEIADAEGRSVHIVHLIRPEEEDPESISPKSVRPSLSIDRDNLSMADLGEGTLASLPSDGEFQAEGSEEADGEIADAEGRAVHIVHLIRPEEEDPESFDIRMLASVIGSEAAAKEAVVYHYTHAASGFAARLTPDQVARLSEKPEVLVVSPDRVCQLIR